MSWVPFAVLLAFCALLTMATDGILLGYDHQRKKPVSLPVSAFDTHVHMVGATGKGKTVAITEFGGSQHVFLASMVAYVGLDPRKDINFVARPAAEAKQLLAEGQTVAALKLLDRPALRSLPPVPAGTGAHGRERSRPAIRGEAKPDRLEHRGASGRRGLRPDGHRHDAAEGLVRALSSRAQRQHRVQLQSESSGLVDHVWMDGWQR